MASPLSLSTNFGFQDLCFWGYSSAPAERFGKNEIIPEVATLASKCLFWCYSAAPAGRFGENITPEAATLAPKSLFWAAPAGRFGENEITPETATLARRSWFWGYSAACAGKSPPRTRHHQGHGGHAGCHHQGRVTTKAGSPPRREGCAWTLSKAGSPPNSPNNYGGANSPPMSHNVTTKAGCPPRRRGSPPRQGHHQGGVVHHQGYQQGWGVPMQEWGHHRFGATKVHVSTMVTSKGEGVTTKGGFVWLPAEAHHQGRVTKDGGSPPPKAGHQVYHAGDHQGRVSYQKDWGHHQGQRVTTNVDHHIKAEWSPPKQNPREVYNGIALNISTPNK